MSEPPISTINVSSNLHAGDDTDSHFVGLNMADIMSKLGGQIQFCAARIAYLVMKMCSLFPDESMTICTYRAF